MGFGDKNAYYLKCALGKNHAYYLKLTLGRKYAYYLKLALGRKDAYYLKWALGRKKTHATSNGLWGTKLWDEAGGRKAGGRSSVQRDKAGGRSWGTKLEDKAPARASAGDLFTPLKNPQGPPLLSRAVCGTLV